MTTAPTELAYGYVDGRLILVIGDSNDTGRMPDPVPAAGTTVQITPKQPIIRVAGADPTTVVKQAITCTLDEDGRLLDPAGARGVWLVTGVYTVTYKSSTAAIPTHDIEVTAAHTESSPLDLTLAMPPGGPVLTPSQYAELSARIDGIVVEASGVSSVNGATGAVTLDAADVGALPSTYTPPAPSWTEVTDKPSTFPPDTHGHAYSEITGTPTIPGPQTLSLSGSDLTLSDGGGTVTLPAGGGGGGATGSVQFAVARTGSPTNLAQSTFTTYPLDGTPTVNIGGGTWNASTFVYTIPSDGLYLCLGAVRIADNSVPRNVMVAIHTSNVDGPFGLWQNMGISSASNGRDGVQYTRLTRFSAGDEVRMYIYSAGATFTTGGNAGQSMSITKLAD